MADESKELALRLAQLDAHAQHIRTIHFTLVITTFVFTVGSFLHAQPDFAKALKELDVVLEAIQVPRQPGSVAAIPWDPKWLDRQIYKKYQQDLFPSIAANAEDVQTFLRQDRKDRETSTYHILGHAFSIRQTPSENFFERLYAANKNGPLFYLTDAELRIKGSNDLFLFFYPCVHPTTTDAKSTVCTMQDSVDDIAFLNKESAKEYQVLRMKPTNIREFRGFWARLISWRIQKPLVGQTPAFANALLMRKVKDPTNKIDIGEIEYCAKIRLEKRLVVPQYRGGDANSVGFGLSTYIPLERVQHRLAKDMPSCEVGEWASRKDGVISWQSRYYAYINPFSSYQNSYAGKAQDRWLIIQFPIAGTSWDALPGPALLHPALTSLADKSFEAAFPNLVRATGRLTDLNWSDLRVVLEDQSLKQSGSVNILSVTIPLESIFLFGSIAICGIQFYLFVCITSFILLARQNPTAFLSQEYPWIGLAPDYLFQGITILTVSALPFAAILGAAITYALEGDLFVRSIMVAMTFTVSASLMMRTIELSKLRKARQLINIIPPDK